jgi:hypothetical protein
VCLDKAFKSPSTVNDSKLLSEVVNKSSFFSPERVMPVFAETWKKLENSAVVMSRVEGPDWSDEDNSEESTNLNLLREIQLDLQTKVVT